MGLILPVQGVLPVWGQNCFIAPNATLCGDVVMGDRCTVWFQAVLRGDVNRIRIGDDTNIQDGAILHGTYRKADTRIGSRVSVGHRAIIHGCTVEDEVLVGMGAILLDHCVVSKGCLVAAGAVVPERMVLREGYLYAGVPAREIKPVTDAQHETILRTSVRYPEYATWIGSSKPAEHLPE
jgi:carbonic anhydrase/acetyltransferase-like protein (isoleucine patch superfamily)